MPDNVFSWSAGGSASGPRGSEPAGPGIFGLRPEPEPRPRIAPPAADKPEPVAGGWVGETLCVLAFAAGVALLVYVFAAPFVPWW